MKKHVVAVILAIVAGLSIFTYFRYQRVNSPLVSVVMLTYKRADIMPQALESILNQTFKDFEFIILNDGSPDNTREVVKSYKDSRIRYVENKNNRGIAYSRNRAASLARGKYIMIMDDDDISLPERMEKQVAFLESHPEITAVAGQITGLARIDLEHNQIASLLIQYNNFGNANVMYRNDFIKKHQISYNEALQASEDWDFWLSILFKGGKFAAITDDVLNRNGISTKHYGTSYETANTPIIKRIGAFFAPQDPDDFYKADACAKLKMIAPKQILTSDFMDEVLTINHCR